MRKARTIRLAFVEYQPNLHHPVTPIRLGVLAEETRRRNYAFVIVGREPKGDLPELQQLWGPFRTVFEEWVGAVAKSMRELEAPAHGAYALDELAQLWNSNLYIKQPESKSLSGSKTLMAYAISWCEQFIGEPVPKLVGPQTNKRRRRKVAKQGEARRWIGRTDSRVDELRA